MFHGMRADMSGCLGAAIDELFVGFKSDLLRISVEYINIYILERNCWLGRAVGVFNKCLFVLDKRNIWILCGYAKRSGRHPSVWLTVSRTHKISLFYANQGNTTPGNYSNDTHTVYWCMVSKSKASRNLFLNQNRPSVLGLIWWQYLHYDAQGPASHIYDLHRSSNGEIEHLIYVYCYDDQTFLSNIIHSQSREYARSDHKETLYRYENLENDPLISNQCRRKKRCCRNKQNTSWRRHQMQVSQAGISNCTPQYLLRCNYLFMYEISDIKVFICYWG